MFLLGDEFIAVSAVAEQRVLRVEPFSSSLENIANSCFKLHRNHNTATSQHKRGDRPSTYFGLAMQTDLFDCERAGDLQLMPIRAILSNRRLKSLTLGTYSLTSGLQLDLDFYVAPTEKGQ